jgi:hypothetical protein
MVFNRIIKLTEYFISLSLKAVSSTGLPCHKSQWRGILNSVRVINLQILQMKRRILCLVERLLTSEEGFGSVELSFRRHVPCQPHSIAIFS